MKKHCFWLAGLLLLFLTPAIAEVKLSADLAAVGETVFVEASDPSGTCAEYAYRIEYDGKKIADGPFVPRASGAFLPQGAGTYTITVRGRAAESSKAVSLGKKTLRVNPALSCSLSASEKEASVGEVVTLKAKVKGGVQDYTYLWQVSTIGAFETDGPEFRFYPNRQGTCEVTLTVRDSHGTAESDSVSLQIMARKAIEIEGSLAGTRAQGDTRLWVIRSPGDWTISSDSDLVTFSRQSGRSGESLWLQIAAGTQEKTAKITLTSGKKTKTVTLTRHAGTGEDLEVSLLGELRDTLLVDGADWAAWQNAEGTRSFQVTASGAWSAEITDQPVKAEVSGSTLKLTALRNRSAAPRSFSIRLTNGSAQAWIYVQQPPYSASPDDSVFGRRVRLPSTDPDADQKAYPYHQFNGTWADDQYKTSELQTSGCAIFTLSTALQLLGYSGPEVEPAALAKAYSFALVEGGTLNATLVGNAGKHFGFKTRYELYESLSAVQRYFSQGAVFSFSVVNGHIALADRISSDGTMIHIIDSALTATFTRIKGATPYIGDEAKGWTAVSDPSGIPGSVYYIATDAFGGGQYWLPSKYVMKRGVRLILPDSGK